MTENTRPSAPAGGPILTAEDFAARTMSPVARIRRFLYRHPSVSPALVLLFTLIFFGLVSDRFFRPENLSLILQQVSVVGTLAVAQTVIILTSGIDLSVGAVMIFSTVVMAISALQFGANGVAALTVGVAFGVLAGGLNGILVTRLKLPPFIVTLGTLSIFHALALLATDGATTRGTELPSLLTWTGTYFDILGVRLNVGVPIMILVYVGMAYLLSRTAFGRHIYAVGDDPEAARLSGIRPRRVLMGVYMLAGAIVFVAAWIFMGRINGVSPNGAVDANLDSVTAVVIGGTSLFGGRGVVWGSLLGALIVGAFRNGLSLAGLDVLYQTLAVGVLIIVAVALDQWIRKADI